jgi:hypothetical protein
MFGVITLATSKGGVGKSSLARSLAAHWFNVGHKPALVDGDRPEIWGTITIRIRPVGYVAGWGFTDGMDAAFGWDRD